jgi:oxygen-independent coproporphyrinogen-3 oxidase
MTGLREAFNIDPAAETSLEAIPSGLDEAYLQGLRRIGFNRLSLGAQSFHDDELRALDRTHSVEDTLRAFSAARAAGFGNISIDVIFGLPEQPMSRWRDSLDQALVLEPEHLSLYALTVEQGTPLARDVDRGRKPAPDPDAQAEQYEYASDRLACAGYEQYEISSWARDGYRCRHNLTYWRVEEYLGLGAGAHSYFRGVRFAVADTPNKYLTLVDQSWQEAGNGADQPMRQVVSGEKMTRELEMSDVMVLGLRVADGVDRRSFRRRFGVDLMDVFAGRLAEPIEHGLVRVSDTDVRLTPRGRLLANEVAARLVP